MTFLQAKQIAAPQVASVNDVTNILNQITSFASSAMPKVIGVAYLAVVIVLLYRLWKQRKSLTLTELIGTGILFGLMR